MAAMKGGRETFTDDRGRDWLVREFVTYGPDTPQPGEFPKVVAAAVVFESDEERRVADVAPLDWRRREGALRELFARARPLSERYSERPRDTTRGRQRGSEGDDARA